MLATMETKLPRLQTALPGPKAKKVLALDEQYVSPSYTRDYPLVAKTGRGAVIEDVDGNVFLDFAAGIAVCSTGHCHPHVVAAIQKQAAELIHMSGTDFYYESLPQLAQRLAGIAPGKEPKRVYFGNSGTEAIEAAMKLARYHTKREKFIAFYGCFHGRTMGALSLTASKAVQRKGFGTLIGGVTHVPYPNAYTGARSDIPPKHAARRRLSCSSVKSSSGSSIPKKSRGSSSSRFKARAAICPRRERSCKKSSASAGSTASCLLWMKCSREWGARENGGPWSTPASSRTSSLRRRGSRRACR